MRHFSVIVSCTLILSVIGPLQVFGQYHTPPRNYKKKNVQSLYFEMFGNGIFYSLNYDIVHKNHLGTRVGVGFDFFTFLFSDPNQNDQTGENKQLFKSVTLVAMENYYVGNGPLRLELGMGGVIGHLDHDLVNKVKVKPPGLTFTTGLRFLPTRPNPINFKVAFTPIIAHGHFYPYVGVSIGWGINTLF